MLNDGRRILDVGLNVGRVGKQGSLGDGLDETIWDDVLLAALESDCWVR